MLAGAGVSAWKALHCDSFPSTKLLKQAQLLQHLASASYAAFVALGFCSAQQPAAAPGTPFRWFCYKVPLVRYLSVNRFPQQPPLTGRFSASCTGVTSQLSAIWLATPCPLQRGQDLRLEGRERFHGHLSKPQR